MRDGSSFDYFLLFLQCWVHQLQWLAFYNTRNCDHEEMLGLWQCRLLGEALGHLDLLVTWTTRISWTFRSFEGALGFLTSWTFGNFDILAIWILEPLDHFDILWSLWWFKLLGNLFGSFLGKLLTSWCFGILHSFSVASLPGEFWLLAIDFIFAQLGDGTN